MSEGTRGHQDIRLSGDGVIDGASLLTWVLGIKFESSTSTVYALNHLSSPPKIYILTNFVSISKWKVAEQEKYGLFDPPQVMYTQHGCTPTAVH